jgi:hypothetical protein
MGGFSDTFGNCCLTFGRNARKLHDFLHQLPQAVIYYFYYQAANALLRALGCPPPHEFTAELFLLASVAGIARSLSPSRQRRLLPRLACRRCAMDKALLSPPPASE